MKHRLEPRRKLCRQIGKPSLLLPTTVKLSSLTNHVIAHFEDKWATCSNVPCALIVLPLAGTVPLFKPRPQCYVFAKNLQQASGDLTGQATSILVHTH